MLHENPRGAGAGDDDRADVVLAVLGHHVGADDARDLRRIHEADREDDGRDGVAQDEHQDCREGDAQDGHDDVEHAHDDLGDGLARDGRDGADDGAEDERERGGAEADHERVLAAVEHAGENVSAGVVRAEEVGPVGRLVGLGDLKRVMRGDDRCKDGGERHQDEKDERNLARDAHVLDAVELGALGRGLLELGGLVLSDLSHGAYTVLMRGLISR